MIGNYKAIQQENFHLREYIIQLQGRLLERHDDVPPPPASIDLTNPPQRPAEDGPAPTASMTTSAVEELQMAARAAEQAAAITGSGGQKDGIFDWSFLSDDSAYDEQMCLLELPAHDLSFGTSDSAYPSPCSDSILADEYFVRTPMSDTRLHSDSPGAYSYVPSFDNDFNCSTDDMPIVRD